MAKFSFFSFILSQYKAVPPVVTKDLNGKTILIVGANTGLGFEAAKHFARMKPARLIITSRNREKGLAAIKKLKEETTYDAELQLVDLASFSSVKEFVKKFEEGDARLDYLIANAAMLSDGNYNTTVDGWESLLQVNYLSLALISLLLLPRLLDTAAKFHTTPRLVIVSSEVHFWTSVDKSVMDSPNILETTNGEKFFTQQSPTTRYAYSKLLDILFALALTEHLPRTLPTPSVVTTNPGFCYSELRRTAFGIAALGNWAMEKALAFTAEQGSRQLIYSALGNTEDEGAMRGAYISHSEITEPSDFVISEEGKVAQEKLWHATISALTKVDPRVQEIVKHWLTT